MCKSLFTTSTFPSVLMSAPVTTPGPLASIYIVCGPSPSIVSAKHLMLRINSVTSSLTPCTVENS